ncbi:LysE family translocator [Algicola sagamiensis]|uniref:LysE family translocator n=1 Tax=Algicola sagamiensis TaxID=163869 RepID=UPI00035E02DA|nr:LysE family transporter [Algicola sagamiensis]
MTYLPEFFLIAAAHFIAVAGPGPDFTIILKNALSYGRKVAVATSIGIGVGILIHIIYSLTGVGLLLQSSPIVFRIFLFLAASYLIYIGIQGLRAKPSSQTESIQTDSSNTISTKKAFTQGFLTNALNPKATLFFLSLFSVAVSATTPFAIKAGYGIYMAIATGCWFSFLSYMLTIEKFRNKLMKNGYWIDRITGVVLILLAVRLLWSEIATMLT